MTRDALDLIVEAVVSAHSGCTIEDISDEIGQPLFDVAESAQRLLERGVIGVGGET